MNENEYIINLDYLLYLQLETLETYTLVGTRVGILASDLQERNVAKRKLKLLEINFSRGTIDNNRLDGPSLYLTLVAHSPARVHNITFNRPCEF